MIVRFDGAATKALYKGRTSVVRIRMNEFLLQCVEGLIYSFFNKTSYKFSWSNFQFNQSQREAILSFLYENTIIENYSKGFSFSEDIYKFTELFPSERIFENIKIEEKIDTVTEVKNSVSVKPIKDDDYRFLSKYVKFINGSLNIPIFRLKRIYSLQYGRGGRIYSGFQNLSFRKRTEIIKINGSKVVENDFKNNHMSIILSLFGKSYDDEDFYDIMSDYYIDRNEVKRAFAIMINATRPLIALTSNRGSLKWETELSKVFIRRFEERFPEVKLLKNGADLGLALQKIEGDIMIEMMRLCMSKNIIILPVHDSIISEEIYDNFILENMMIVRNNVISNNSEMLKGLIK